MENIYGVKVGDIFYTEKHYFISFYQVVALKGTKQIIIKAIDRKVIGKAEPCGQIVIKDKNNFIECSYIKDNSIGATKIVQKKKNDNKEKIYITFNYFYNISFGGKLRETSFYETAELWDGTPKKHEVIYY